MSSVADLAAPPPTADAASPLHPAHATPARIGPPAEAWYLVTPAAVLRPGALHPARILGQPIVLGRDAQGQVFALADRCPHRGAALSGGRFDGTTVQCPFHGWRFAAQGGACTHIPAAPEAIPRAGLRVPSLRTREAYGAIWVYPGAGDPAHAPPPYPLSDMAPDRAPDLAVTVRAAADFDLCAISLVDPGHVPFVHTAWWWGRAKAPRLKAKAHAPSDYGFTMTAHAPSAGAGTAYRLLGGTPTVEVAFLLPGVRFETIRAGANWIRNVTVATPIDRGITEMTNLIYTSVPWLRALAPIVRPIARKFLGQDRDILQSAQLGQDAGGTFLFAGDADIPSRWLVRSLREYTAARAAGRPYRNPVEPAVLRWWT